MERGERVIKLLHSIWKWNIFWFLPVLSGFFFAPSRRLWASLQSPQRLCKQRRSLSRSSIHPSPHPKPHTSTWNDGWWNYSKNIDLLPAGTLSRSPNGLGFYSDSCFCSGAGGAGEHLETHGDKTETGLILLLVHSRFMWFLFVKTPWNTFYCYFYYSCIFLHSFIVIISVCSFIDLTDEQEQCLWCG